MVSRAESPAGTRLVFGDDRSDAADVAWLWINEHEWPGWRIDVVTADFDVRHPAPPHVGGVLTEWTPQAFDVRSTILEMIGFEQPDLVALGTRGLGLGHRLRHGSTATAVAHHAPCSVLVTRA